LTVYVVFVSRCTRLFEECIRLLFVAVFLWQTTVQRSAFPDCAKYRQSCCYWSCWLSQNWLWLPNPTVRALLAFVWSTVRSRESPGQKYGVDTHGKRIARTYNEILGHSPQRGLGQSPLLGDQEAKTSSARSWKSFSFWMPNRSSKFALFCVFFKLASRVPNVTDIVPDSPPVKSSPDMHESQEQPLAKLGWTCPPQSIRGVCC